MTIDSCYDLQGRKGGQHLIQSYDHEHDGELRVTWEQFDSLCRILAITISGYDPQVIVGIAKGGVLPATVIASLLRREFYPIRLSRRHDDEVVRETPELLVGPPPAIAGQRVLLVDDMIATGATMTMAGQACVEQGAAEVRTACLFAHSSGQRPDYVASISDALIVFPWDREVLTGGHFVPHPEYEEHRSQGSVLSPSELSGNSAERPVLRPPPSGSRGQAVG
jgi:hypoxanthine phosphoribosyltransferase